MALLLQHAEEASECESPSGTSHELWTEKWRPRRADEVVGNEQHAFYLRDWLAALRVQPDTVDSPSASPRYPMMSGARALCLFVAR